jgi:predicted RNA binding protein YcfA (HicA-like mRNA interferase family)
MPSAKVREVIKMLEQDGWNLVRQRGSHRQFRHPQKPGTVTIPGDASAHLHPRTLASIKKPAGLP